MMKVLHDMDRPYLGAFPALKRGAMLILYAISRVVRLRFEFMDNIYEEVRENADVLIKLDKLVGVESVVGVRDEICRSYPHIMERLKEYDVDVREHIHIGKRHLNRKRLWIPPLNQPKETWHYDRDYIDGNKVMLKKGQLPIWHIDRPDRVKDYINFLYSVLVEGEQIYENLEGK